MFFLESNVFKKKTLPFSSYFSFLSYYKNTKSTKQSTLYCYYDIYSLVTRVLIKHSGSYRTQVLQNLNIFCRLLLNCQNFSFLNLFNQVCLGDFFNLKNKQCKVIQNLQRPPDVTTYIPKKNFIFNTHYYYYIHITGQALGFS